MYCKIYYLLALLFLSCSGGIQRDYLKEGNSFFDKKEYEQAVNFYDSAIKMDQDYRNAYILKGKSLEYLNRYSLAIDNYNEFLELAPRDPIGLARRGICYLAISDFSDARSDLVRSLKLNPTNTEALSSLGFCKIRQKDTSGFRDLDQAIELGPDSYLVYYNRALAKYDTQQFATAMNDFYKSVEIKPDFAEGFLCIGLCQNKLNNKEQACHFWNLALEKGAKRVQTLITENCK
jgi:tetratricopeptide (TPR) repeat protein